jgi:hypothetical protein
VGFVNHPLSPTLCSLCLPPTLPCWRPQEFKDSDAQWLEVVHAGAELEHYGSDRDANIAPLRRLVARIQTGFIGKGGAM